ncbi:MAG TPA: conjugal transfer protein TraF [Vicinamibacterales bacterium]|nr:conjugal transfer protein TraF [Vicinamibacterales bacterium]
MISKFAGRLSVLLLLLPALPVTVNAQSLDQLGNRASAIGAFVAVADDASAVVWNPAGLVNGPIFNVLWDLGHSIVEPEADVASATQPAGRVTGLFLAAGVAPLGFSYGRTRFTEVGPRADSGSGGPAAGASSDRHIRQVVLRSLVTSHVGVTVLQSLADGVTVGATVKLIRGSVGSGGFGASSWDDAFDRAETIEGHGRTTGDIDLGALVSRGHMRFGAVARNLTAPRFDDGLDGPAMRLRRHVRAGGAWGDNWPGTSKLIVSVDADFTRVPHPTGDRRDMAAGVERWFRGTRLAVRGGVRASTVDDVRPIASAGGSLAVRRGMYVDVYGAKGAHEERRWGVSARLTY